MYQELVDLSDATPISPPELRGWWCVQLAEGQEFTEQDVFGGKPMYDQSGKPIMRSYASHSKCLYDGGKDGSLLMFPSRQKCKEAIESYRKGEYSEHARIMDGMNPVAPPVNLPERVQPAERKAS